MDLNPSLYAEEIVQLFPLMNSNFELPIFYLENKEKLDIPSSLHLHHQRINPRPDPDFSSDIQHTNSTVCLYIAQLGYPKNVWTITVYSL